MNTKVLIGGFAAVAVVAVAGTAFALSRPAATNQNDNNQSNAMSLPAEKVASLNDAQSKLSYKLQLPTENLGATLSEIVVGQKTGFIDNSDTLFVSYVKNGATLFKVSNTTQEGNDPTDTKAVDLNGVAGHYYFIGEQDGAMSMGAAAAPRSYLFWKVNGVRYEVSEFGKVSEAELTQVAKSFQKLN